MTHEPMNTIMRDGSRKFAELPQTVLWEEVRDHIATLEGATITGFITDQVTEGWIDFTYCNYQFAVNDQFGQYWFFVADPVCPEEILQTVILIRHSYWQIQTASQSDFLPEKTD